MTDTSSPELLARDVYRVWKRRVQAAHSSVRVFTPYLDLMLGRLLKNADLEPEAIKVVTDLSPASGAAYYRGQLLGIRGLLRTGVEVRTLDRLHAKVLQVDGAVTVGSQNFTTYGRGSKETTAVLTEGVAGTRFDEQLDEWFAQATPVDLELVEALLLRLTDHVQAVDNAREALLTAYRSTVVEWEGDPIQVRADRDRSQARSRPLATELREALAWHRQMNPNSYAVARLESVERRDSWPGDDYETLKVQVGDDLTTWTVTGDDGGRHSIDLDWLHFYPLLLTDTGRMAYGRIAKTRITFVESGVTLAPGLRIGNHLVQLQTHCPRTALDSRNMVVTGTVLAHGFLPGGDFTLEVRFGGQGMLVTNVEPRPGQAADGGEVLRDVVTAMQQDHRDRLTTRLLSPIKYKRLGIDNPTAHLFFDEGWYTVRPVVIAGNTILTFSQTW